MSGDHEPRDDGLEDVEGEDGDIKFEKAASAYLVKLKTSLPRLLRRKRISQQHLGAILGSIEPFQEAPHLLDTSLKDIVPPIVTAYLAHLTQCRQRPSEEPDANSVSLQNAVGSILYTLCKARGYKVIVGFFNNEPRYFETIVEALEASQRLGSEHWQVRYVLLRWLSHLLLTPFDLKTISDRAPGGESWEGLSEKVVLPPLAARTLSLAWQHLFTSTREQDAAAACLVRLSNRPDMQNLALADTLTNKCLDALSSCGPTVYHQTGVLRFLAGVTASADLAHLLPAVYRSCLEFAERKSAPDAVTKRLLVKTFRNAAVLSLHLASATGPLLSFLEVTDVLEDVIEFLLRSLGDRDTPVRYAAAKAIGILVLELGPEMGQQVIDAVLESFKEDILRTGDALDFRTANVLKWHGLTLTLAHTLFKRSASPEQLSDIVVALVAALQFEQRTATGSSIGSNVRDAANFGIWSLCRRYTTAELAAADTLALKTLPGGTSSSVIQKVAIQLLLSACLDPEGNIRRGSSAALQELIGRHPNQVVDGIVLVQIVDYLAVGLRRRAIEEVAVTASALLDVYWNALVDGLLGWRGLGSIDVNSREAAGCAFAKLGDLPYDTGEVVCTKVLDLVSMGNVSELELLHGILLTIAKLLNRGSSMSSGTMNRLWSLAPFLDRCSQDFSPRALRAELPRAVAQFLTSLCRFSHPRSPELTCNINATIESLLDRNNDSLLETLPELVVSVWQLKRRVAAQTGNESLLGCTEMGRLCKKLTIDSRKSSTIGAGRAIAVGALVCLPNVGYGGLTALEALATSPNVEWRIMGIRAIQSVVSVSGNTHWLRERAHNDTCLAEQTLQRPTLEPSAADDKPAHKSSNPLEAPFNLNPEDMTRLAVVVHIGLNDYTIDERGDIGSQVRLRALSCVPWIVQRCAHGPILAGIEASVTRLALEKLDRVRAAAARVLFQCFDSYKSSKYFDGSTAVQEISVNVTSVEFFATLLEPLRNSSTPTHLLSALLSGAVSSAGSAQSSVQSVARQAIYATLLEAPRPALLPMVRHFTATLKGVSTQPGVHATLSLLVFLLESQLLAPLSLEHEDPSLNPIPLLAAVQRCHHKTSDPQLLLLATRTYAALWTGFPLAQSDGNHKIPRDNSALEQNASVAVDVVDPRFQSATRENVSKMRSEILKKLASMLKSNPFPRVRESLAEAAWVCLQESKGGGAWRDGELVDWKSSSSDEKRTTALQFLENTARTILST